MKSQPLSRLILVCACSLIASTTFAENTNQVSRASAHPATKMEEVVVSATRFEEESWKSGSSISVVPQETYQLRRQLQTLDPLRGEPGVTINNPTSIPAGLSQISIRGMPFSRTLIQVDGLRFNRPVDNIANFADLPPLLLGNVELLRGPQSSLYGSEAEGGVVTFAIPRGEGDPTYGTSFETGTFDTRRERVFSQGKHEEFDWNVEASRLDSANERPNNGTRQTAGAMRLGGDVTETVRLDLTSRYSDFTTGTVGNTRGLGANDPDNRLIRRMLLVSPSVTVTPFEAWESKLTLGYIGVGQRSESPPSEFVNHSESLQLNWQNTIHTAEWNTLVVGTDARNEHTTTEASSGNNVFNRASQGAYATDSIRVVDWWGITLSGRFDDNEGFRDAWTYRASQVFKAPVTDTRVHMSFGTAFRAPAISELKNLFGPTSGANPSLVPETSEGYDIGITQPILDGNLEWDTTYFYNNIVNLIATDAAFKFQNISEARAEGIENSLKWKVINGLSARGSFTINATTSKDRRFSGNDLVRIPRHTASLSLVWEPDEQWEISPVWNYTGQAFDNATNTQKLAEYHRLDLFVSYQAMKWLKVFGRGENLIGYRYQQAAGFPSLGRTFIGGFEVQF